MDLLTKRVLLALATVCALLPWPLQAQDRPTPSPGHYLFAWTGDAAQKGNDFLAVIDADPKSPAYGRLVTTLTTDQQTKKAHHTEYTMPSSGMLFANDHDAGRTFIFNLTDPLHPTVSASFEDLAGFMHPHSYLRLPNGNVLATFQHKHHGEGGGLGKTGGLVEIDDQGRVIRAVSSADPGFSGALLTPYSLIVVPEADRVVSTNSSMHDDDLFRGLTYQVWRLSDLTLLRTAYFDTGEAHYGQISPEEPRLGPDGSIYVQTLACGIERITGIDGDKPQSTLVHLFPGSFCGVPTIVGHYLIQTVPVTHGLIVLDIADPQKPVEVSRLKLGDDYNPHWTSWDAKTQRLAVTPTEFGIVPTADRLFLLTLDQATGALALDEAFQDTDGKAGFNFDQRAWPHGWRGSGVPHGVVFSR